MSGSQYINQGISNYTNQVRSTMQNPVQTSSVKTPKFDLHDRMLYGNARDRLYISRMRELNIKRKRQEISPETYDAYVKSLKNEPHEEEEAHENTGENAAGVACESKGEPTPETPTEPARPPVDEKSLLDLIYPVGTIYTRNINELPFDFGKWELLTTPPVPEEDDLEESPEQQSLYQWVRIF